MRDELRRRRRANMPTWVYKFRCAHGGLLYVGITENIDQRIRQHRREKEWWGEVEHVTSWLMPSRAEARAAELWCIEHESPSYNIEGVVDYDQYMADRWRDIVGRDNFTQRVLRRENGDL